ncbi:M81 family metallopeptidase [Kroppenstedtia pulmonis]|uniref:M81 family metallopeptidase n=1 Tax=Kroppenstedtia pulmonis TaxID=1380685 RepID=A0A7D3XZY0_9BACL|nr:M81 family metallopeptidase [Kroppenstedtia pulmonis]QKG83980.1 M81 family metallopeptidase [Kroppenstedtia pulmonis]
MRIAIGQINHETNTFSCEYTREDSFHNMEWSEGEGIISTHEGVQDYLGGMIDQGREMGVNILPTLSVEANPSGMISSETWRRIKGVFLEKLQALDQVDAVCLALHGAGVSEDCSDIEGDLLRGIRDMLGWEIPIVATLDLHANMTADMVRYANMLLSVHLYPHTDEYDRGREAMQRTVEMIRGELHPCMHLEKLPLILPTTNTMSFPAKEINELCWKWEKKEKVLDCSFIHGFPYADIPHVGASVLVTSHQDRELAQQIAREVAEEVWNKRQSFHCTHPGPGEGLKKALQSAAYPVLINETSDNPGAGAPGDGTHLLAELLSANLEETCLGAICDPDVAEAAHKSGVGSFIDVELGGKVDNRHGKPLKVRAYVKVLSDGEFIQQSAMESGKKIRLGKSARLVIGHVDVVVCSLKAQLLDDELLRLHGIQIDRYKIIGIKSSQHFRGFFQDRVSEIITVDSPGLSTYNLSVFDFNHVPRPVYPLDPSTEYK